MRFMAELYRFFQRAVVLAMVAGAAAAAQQKVPADAIYFGGRIITMTDVKPEPMAVAVRDHRIVAVGARETVESEWGGTATRRIDLENRALLPGFIDAHSHFSQVGVLAVSANLLPPPDGVGGAGQRGVKNIAEIQKNLREFIESKGAGWTGVVIGFDYDDSQLAGGHPTRAQLDEVSKDLPIFLVHQSTHLSVSNTRALEQSHHTEPELAARGITKEHPTIEAGGKFYFGNDGKLTGLADENAHAEIAGALLKFEPEELAAMLVEAQKQYVENGFTTVQEGRADPNTLQAIAAAAKAGKFQVDVVAYPDLDWLVAAEKESLMSGASRDYANHFRIGGVKLALDGSPQGRTAWFKDAYFQAPPDTPANYRGVSTYAGDKLKPLVEKAYRNGWQLMMHANGDAAIDQMIEAIGAVQKGQPDSSRRTVLIHGQFMRPNQIPELKRLGIFPSIFPLHTFYWGDWHRDVVAGKERAAFISPAAALLANEMRFSIHGDAPLTFPKSMRIIDSAVNRTTRTNEVLGGDQRIAPIVALKAMTLWPAYQHFEEANKGSIEVGKLADFVVLAHDPLQHPAARLFEIAVVETIKGGETIYRSKNQPPLKEE
jgi:predicted amidohydrolase YtcJ